MKKKVLSAVIAFILIVAAFFAGWRIGGSNMPFLPPVEAALPQDASQMGIEEQAVIDASGKFWTAMEQADETGMREIADPNCTFVHIGMTCRLDEEIGFYTSGAFRPTSIDFHGQSVQIFDKTAVVLTDCDYALQIGAGSTSHHFAVTEVYVQQEDGWKLVQFSFTALIS